MERRVFWVMAEDLLPDELKPVFFIWVTDD